MRKAAPQFWALMVGAFVVIVAHTFHLFGSAPYLLPGSVVALAFSVFMYRRDAPNRDGGRTPELWPAATGVSFVVAGHTLTEWDVFVPAAVLFPVSCAALAACAFGWWRTAHPDVRVRRVLRKRALFAAWLAGWTAAFLVASVRNPSWGDASRAMLHSGALWLGVLYGLTWAGFWVCLPIMGKITGAEIGRVWKERASLTVRLQAALANAQERRSWWVVYWCSTVLLACNVLLPLALAYQLPRSGVTVVFLFAAAETLLVAVPCAVWLFLVSRHRERLRYMNPTIGLCDTMMDVAMPEERSTGDVKVSVRLAGARGSDPRG